MHRQRGEKKFRKKKFRKKKFKHGSELRRAIPPLLIFYYFWPSHAKPRPMSSHRYLIISSHRYLILSSIPQPVPWFSGLRLRQRHEAAV